MKNLLLLLFLLVPSLVFCKTKWANVCDSLSKTISIPGKTQSELASNSFKQLSTYKMQGRNERISTTQINDSTILCTGTIQLQKTAGVKIHPKYGKYKVHYAADGFVDFKIVIKVHDGFFSYEIGGLNHYGARAEFGNFCNAENGTNIYVNGVKVVFKNRIDEIINNILYIYVIN